MPKGPVRKPRRSLCRPRTLAAAVMVCLCCALPACTGRAHVEISSLNYKSIDPPAARASRLDLGECYWWTDDSGQLWIAMQEERSFFFARYARTLLQMSFALEKLPAGHARNYSLSARELRGRVHAGPVESRLLSSVGIAAVYRHPGDRLRGSFRVLIRRYTARLLGGWEKPAVYLLQGSFEAVHDPQRGPPIAVATESRGWERPAAPPSTAVPEQPGDEATPPPSPASETQPVPAPNRPPPVDPVVTAAFEGP